MRFTNFAALAAAAVMSVSMAQCPGSHGWPSELTVGTASQGGVYFVYGNGLASFMGEELGINSTGEVTGGPVQNVTLLQMQEHDIGLVTMGPMYEAWTGKSELAPGLPHKMCARCSRCMKHRSRASPCAARISPRSLIWRQARQRWPRWRHTRHLLAALHRSAGRRRANVSFAGAADAASQLQDGLIDAFVFAAGLPIGASRSWLRKPMCALFGFNDAEHAQIKEAFPEVSNFTIPAGTYTVQDEDQPSVAMWNFAVATPICPKAWPMKSPSW
jgi:uncharacterized protein